DVDRHLAQPGGPGRPQSPLPGDELKLVPGLAHHQRLEHAVRLDTVPQPVQLVLVEPLPRLVRVLLDPPDGHPVRPAAVLPVSDERIQPPPHPRLRRVHAIPLRFDPEPPASYHPPRGGEGEPTVPRGTVPATAATRST